MWYYLDSGWYGAYAFKNDHLDYPIFTPFNEGPLVKSALTGPTCDSIDMVRSEIMLPDLSIGDILVSKYMGCYTSVGEIQFCSKNQNCSGR